MSFNLNILTFGEIEAMESVLFYNGDCEKYRKIGCFAWMLQKEKEIILIDTGIKDIKVVNKTRKGSKEWLQNSEQTMESNLDCLGVRPEDVTKIILTHSHYDHISNIPLFKNANVYISRREYEFLYDKNNKLKEYLVEAKEHIEFLKQRKKLILIEKDMCINDEVLVQWVGGHTPGGQIVIVDANIGKCLIAGDAVFLEENIKKHLPIGLTTDYKQSINVLKICEQFNGKCLFSHDMKMLNWLEGRKETCLS